MLSLQAGSLAKITGVKLEEIQLLKMNLMGVKFIPEKQKENSTKKKGDSSSKK